MIWDYLLQIETSVYIFVAVGLITTLTLFVHYWQPGWCRCKNQLNGKTVIVTGANSGIGKETAKELARRGAKVILACRNLRKAREALKEIEPLAKAELKIRHIDLSSMKSVRSFAERILEEEPRIDILINNAGLMYSKLTTEDGFDIQLATNYLGPFLLTNLLLDRIKASVPSRIINVSSIVHRAGNIHWHDLNMSNRYYFRSTAQYYQTKLAQVLFSAELRRRLAGSGVAVYALHPGGVWTPFALNDLDWMSKIFILGLKLSGLIFYKSPRAGAQTSVHCAVAEELQKQKGLYYSDCKEVTHHSLANDEAVCRKLWDLSETLVELTEGTDNNCNENVYKKKLTENGRPKLNSSE